MTTNNRPGELAVGSTAEPSNITPEIDIIASNESRLKDDPYILVGIPAYHAESSVGRVVKKAMEFVDTVLVVDDGSKDATAARAREAGASVVRHKRNQGYGGALQTIFNEAYERDADYLITLDADEQHDPAAIPTLVKAQNQSDADVVIGSRYVTGSDTDLPLIRSLGLAMVNLFTNWSMGRFPPRNWIKDTQSGFRAYSSEAIESLVSATEIGDGMWASTNILYHMNRENFTFLEVGTTIRYDVEHGSSEGTLSHGMSLITNIFRFAQRTHPITLLGVPGGLFFILGCLLGAQAIESLLLSSVVPLRLVGLTISSSILLFFGTSLSFLAILFHVINIHPYFQK